MNEENPKRNAIKIIQDLGIEGQKEAEKYEKCETVARMTPEEVLEEIKDPEKKAEVKWIKEVHKKGFPSLDNWRNAFAQKIIDLIEETGGLEEIKKWHELEAICEELPEEKIEEMKNSEKKTIETIKNIHERSSKRRIEILKDIEEKSEPEKNSRKK